MRHSVCVVGPRATREDAERRDCEAREHRHVTAEQAKEMVHAEEASWLIGSSVIQLTAEESSVNRLSIQVGETLAMMVYRGSHIARQMVGEIRRKT